MPHRPKIILDCDGVCGDFITPVTRAANFIMGRTDLTPKLVDQWEMTKSYGMDATQKAALFRIISAPGFCASLRPYPGAVMGIREIATFADVHVATFPWDGDYWHRERELWCRDVLGIPRFRVAQLSAKELMTEGDVLVEDKAETLVEWNHAKRRHAGTALPILFARPWNRRSGWTGSEVETWPQLVNLLKRRFT